MIGHKLQETELWHRCPELKEQLEKSRSDVPQTVQFDCYANASTMVTNDDQTHPVRVWLGTGGNADLHGKCYLAHDAAKHH